MSRQTIGIPGALGALVLLVWAIGWLVFGWHEGLYHLLFPAALVLILIQVTRRVAAG